MTSLVKAYRISLNLDQHYDLGHINLVKSCIGVLVGLFSNQTNKQTCAATTKIPKPSPPPFLLR